MKQTKKLTALILTVLMLLSAAPITVAASTEEKTITSYSVGDIIEFGWYPQSEVTDADTIAALNAACGNWIAYNYYSGTGSWSDGNMTASDYMRYKDVLLDGNKYRGVVFDSYRPYRTDYTSTGGTYQDDNGYSTNTVYWFKYDPILWRILDPATGMVISEAILDSQPYNNFLLDSGDIDEYENTAYWGDPAKTHYANNYEKSSIRAWLNNDFYNTAFSAAQQNIIVSTTIDNSAYSTSYSAYDAASTKDNIYLLSYADARNADYGFSRSSARQAQGSNYAKCQGLGVYSDNGYAYWLLRSAGGSSYSCCHVDNYGFGFYDTNFTYYGIRPALNINLTTEIFQSKIEELGNVGQYTHSHTGTVTTPATHLATGVMTYTCSACGDIYTEEIAKTTEHSHEAVIIAPTCTEQGYTTYTCACGDNYVADYVKQSAHSKVLINEKAATATEDGYTGDIVCSVCSSVIEKGEVIPATGEEVNTCDHLCHKNGIMGFFWKIIRFFRKLFGMNPVCECGAAHY